MSQSADSTLQEPFGSDRTVPIGTARLTSGAKTSGFAKLLVSMFRIGLLGFGGGSALIPVIEEEVVNEQGFVTSSEYEEEVVSACVTPGALPVEIAAGIGHKTLGMLGMLAAAVFMALPGSLMMVLILSAASGSSSGSLDVIRFLSIGIGAFICALLISYTARTVGVARKKNSGCYAISVAIMAVVFAVTGGQNLLKLLGFENLAKSFIHLSTLQVLMISFSTILAVHIVRAVLGTSVGGPAEKMKQDTAVADVEAGSVLKETLVWILFAALFAMPAILMLADGKRFVVRGLTSSLMSFGGGDAYLSVADGLFVSGGMVSQESFYGLLVPVANVLPGSILCKILTGVGYLIGLSEGGSRLAGAAGALAGFGISIAASGMVFGIVYWIFQRFENVSIFREISQWIRPIISGLLLGVLVTMLQTNISTASSLGRSVPATVILTACLVLTDLYLMERKKSGSLLPMVLSAGVGTLILLMTG